MIKDTDTKYFLGDFEKRSILINYKNMEFEFKNLSLITKISVFFHGKPIKTIYYQNTTNKFLMSKNNIEEIRGVLNELEEELKLKQKN